MAAIYSTSCSGAMTRSSTTSACEKLNMASAMERAGLVGDDGPNPRRRLRHLLPALACRHGVRWRRVTRRCSSTCAQALVERRGPVGGAVPARGGQGRVPARRGPVEIGTASCPGGRACGVRLRLRGKRGEWRGPPAGGRSAIKPTVPGRRLAEPLDGDLVERPAAEHELPVTLRGERRAGGFGSGVPERWPTAACRRTRILRIGCPGPLRDHGELALLPRRSGSRPRPWPSGSPRPCSSRRWPSCPGGVASG